MRVCDCTFKAWYHRILCIKGLGSWHSSPWVHPLGFHQEGTGISWMPQLFSLVSLGVGHASCKKIGNAALKSRALYEQERTTGQPYMLPWTSAELVDPLEAGFLLDAHQEHAGRVLMNTCTVTYVTCCLLTQTRAWASHVSRHWS